MREPVFTGACTALVTPFDDSGAINYDAFAAQIDAQIDSGIDALCAATGLPAGRVLAACTELELYGGAQALPGRRYTAL